MKKIALTILLACALAPVAHAFKAVPAQWRHELSSTYLVGYKKNEHLILSSITTGRVGSNAVQKYGLDVKVTAWGKPFTAMRESRERNEKEVFTVTLYRLPNTREMKAVFTDTVYQSGMIKLQFSGTTVLARLDELNNS